jgi:hypothetical protein
MSFVIKGRSSVFLTKEITEGVYVAPSNENQAVEVLEDFSGFELTRETIERSVLSSTVESESPRAGLPDVTGSLPTEFKSGAVEGGAPRSDVLLESLLGGKRSVAAGIELVAGSTDTILNIPDVNSGDIKAGDSVLVKAAAKYEVRPVLSVNEGTGEGDASITLAIALSEAPAAGVEIAPLTTYFFNENDESFSVTAELGGELLEQARGCKVESAEISNWTTGQIPNIAFAIKALGLDKVDDSTGLTPDFSAEPRPPVALQACAFLDGVELDYNEFSLTMANTITDLLSACKPDGKVASRNTNFLVTGSINPYMEADDVGRFQKFNQSQNLSLFIYIGNPSETSGEMENVCAIWMPKITITGLTNGDQEGVLTDEIEFQASKTVSNDTIFLSFI